jgi:hypothetical protein
MALGSTRFIQALQVLTSQEGYSFLTEQMYEHLLDRTAEATARTNEAAALMSGQTDFGLTSELASSDEFYNKTVQ